MADTAPKPGEFTPIDKNFQEFKLGYDRESALFVCKMLSLYGMKAEAQHLYETINLSRGCFKKTLDAALRLLELEVIDA